ncbi:MAG: PEGA domain-containing protein [Deltaproteobacteria bacterium]|nr:PEGA domain-containing protein [Deltaproteobacteria bacterium]
MIGWFRSFFVVIIMLASLISFAQDDSKKEEAKKHFELGKAYYKQSEYKKAIEEFQKAYSYYPHSVILYNIAQAYEKEGNIPMALRYFKEYLRASPNAEDKNIILIAIQNLEKKLQEKGIQQVGIYSTPPDAEVAINGNIVGKTPFVIELSPGKYTLSLTKKGYIPIDKEFVVSPDKSLELDFTLNEINVEETKKTPVEIRRDVAQEEPKKLEVKPDITRETVLRSVKEEKSEGKRLWTYIMGGAGILTVGTGVVLGIMATSAESNLKSDKNITRSQEDAQRLADKAQNYAMLANIFYGAGAACLVSATVLFFTESKKEKKDKPQGAGILYFNDMVFFSYNKRF